MTNEIQLPVLKCLICGHEWHPRQTTPPDRCPNQKCHSPNWNRTEFIRTSKKRASVRPEVDRESSVSA